MAAVNLGRVGLNPMGEYDENTDYERLDVVSYMGSTYCAVRAVKGQPPGESGAWRVMAKLTAAAVADALGYEPAERQGCLQASRDVERLKRAVSVLYDINRGISYRFEEDSEAESVKTAPSGAKAAVVTALSDDVTAVTVRGRNLCNAELFEQGDVVSSLNWGTNRNRVALKADIDVSGYDSVRLSNDLYNYIYTLYSNGVCQKRTVTNSSRVTIELADYDMLRFCLLKADGTALTVEEAKRARVMLSAGGEAADYAPYRCESYVPPLNEPFTVEPGGEIAFEGGEGAVKYLIALNEVEL